MTFIIDGNSYATYTATNYDTLDLGTGGVSNVASVIADTESYVYKFDSVNLGSTGNSGVLSLVGGTGGAYSLDFTITNPSAADPNYGHGASINVGSSQDGAYGRLNLSNGARLTSVSTSVYNVGQSSYFGGYNNVNVGIGDSSAGKIYLADSGTFLGAYGIGASNGLRA